MKTAKNKGQHPDHSSHLHAIIVADGAKEKSRNPKKMGLKKSPSYQKIFLIIAIVAILGFSFPMGWKYLRGEESPGLPLSSSHPAVSHTVDENQVVAVAQNFACACEGCNELLLAKCQCDMPRGALEEKKFIREKLAGGFTVAQVVDLLDKKYGHRI
jgi:hypothetical protein